MRAIRVVSTSDIPESESELELEWLPVLAEPS